ncbi:hypothetical protein E1281_20785 [Actinomadura sp. KC345]|uniref:hypothetical protein n=1 Tax=Actinomadura sp. KC345 TaxID=2530371 RepID=UPI00104DBE39|nr:hypothetical protein [Actinomadura sp. KC345]TDC51175.1 hypothetical protein E1281_20785 [Actinomadura sp. KC345]
MIKKSRRRSRLAVAWCAVLLALVIGSAAVQIAGLGLMTLLPLLALSCARASGRGAASSARLDL